jgi:protein-disulfide isomerase
LTEWAVSLGLDKSAFERDYANAKTRDDLIAFKQEGIRNKVNATPTLFIDGIKYVYEIDAKITIDVLAEQYERRVSMTKAK